MDDFTQKKLINSLIDVVDRFYTLKDSQDAETSWRLKGFCEGLSYALVKTGAIDQEEAQKIMQGLGKKRDLSEQPMRSVEVKTEPEPSKTTDQIVEEIKLEEIKEPIHQINRIHQTRVEDDLDLPTYLRKKSR